MLDEIKDMMSPEDVKTLVTAGELYTDAINDAINDAVYIQNEADADLWLGSRISDVLSAAHKFTSRIIADHESTRVPGRGVIVMRRKDGRYAAVPYTAYINDGRSYGKATITDTEDSAREAANNIWISRSY